MLALPFAFHVITFVLWMDNGQYDPHRRPQGNYAPCITRSSDPRSEASSLPRSFQCVQLLQPLAASRSISNLVIAAIRAMLPEPSSILLDLLRNVGVYAATTNGGVQLSIWRYEIQSGRPTVLPINNAGLFSDFRDHRYIAALTVALQADSTWRIHGPLPPPFREVTLPPEPIGSS